MTLNKLVDIPPVIAHRGASAYAPENTRASFLKASALGAKWVEFDVQLTADGKVVVYHDEKLGRTNNGEGVLINCTLDYLKSLDIGSWFNPFFCHEKILTLEEMMVLLQEQQLGANIELKVALGQEQPLVDAVMGILQHESTLPLLISSFNIKAIQAVRKIHASIPLGYLLDEWADDWRVTADALHCASVNLCDRIVTKERISAIMQAGYAVMIYTVNDPVRAAVLFEWGVSAVFSDCPDKIIAAGYRTENRAARVSKR